MEDTYKMYTSHWTTIVKYEDFFGYSPNGAAGLASRADGRNGLDAVRSDFGITIDDLATALTPAARTLWEEYVKDGAYDPMRINPANILIDINGDAGTRIDATTMEGYKPNGRLVFKDDNNLLIGLGGDDILIGGKGNDILNGGQGYDTYAWTTGDGDDTLIDSDKKGRILINGSGLGILIKQSATIWTTADNKVTLTQGDTWKLTMDGGSIDLGTSFNDGDYGITRSELATGGTLLKGDLDPILDGNGDLQYDADGNVVVDPAVEAPGRIDTLHGSTSADSIRALAGNDVIEAAGGNDLVEGGSGNDIVAGQDGADTVWGDTALTDASPLATALANGDADTSQTAKGDWVDGGDDDDILIGAAAQDLLSGGTDNDLLIAGAGDDLLDGGADDDVLFGDAGNDVLLGGTGDDVINGDRADLAENLQGSDWIDGGAGNDRIFGMAGDDILIGGAGTDTIWGGAGRDTYLFNKGDGIDTLHDDDTGPEKSILVFGEGFDPNSIKLRKGSLLLDLGDGDAIHIENFDAENPLGTQSFSSFQFADGTSLTWEELLAKGFDLDGTDLTTSIEGTNTTDRIDGRAGNDLIWGLDGDDVITGGTGTDGLDGGLGDDSYIVHAGDGATLAGPSGEQTETLVDDGGLDTVSFAADIDPQHILVQDNLDGGLLIDYHAYAQLVGEYGSGVFRGSDTQGRAIVAGGNSDDLIVVADDHALVSAGQGRDTLLLTGADATLAVYRGDGVDRLDAPGTNATLRFADQNADAIRVSRTGNDLVLANAQGDALTVANWLASDGLGAGVQTVAFADGTAWNGDALRAALLAGTAGNDHLIGYGMGDTISAGEGNDLLEGRGGDDNLTGGSGDDTLTGGAGNDQLWRPRIVHESRRWQDADDITAPINDSTWRLSA
jgi:Ca2+-binding RTX toxin-like protein